MPPAGRRIFQSFSMSIKEDDRFVIRKSSYHEFSDVARKSYKDRPLRFVAAAGA